MDLSKMVGYKFFKKKNDDELEVIRLLKYKYANKKEVMTFIDLDTKEVKELDLSLLKEYTALKPEAIIMISGVELEGTKDVITAAYLLDRLENHIDVRPFCVCRQGITDVFYNLLMQDETQMLAGLSVNVLDIPQGFDYGNMLLSDEVLFSNTYMTYKDDTVESLLDLYKDDIKGYDNILEELYAEHCKSNPKALFSDEDKGWCKSLLKLLTENNFQSDLDEMFGITTVEFDISQYLKEDKISEDSEQTYITIEDELKYWLSYLYKLDINKVFVLPYDNDIDFEDLKQSRYFIFRDSTKKLYVFVYTIGKEYKEAELEELDNKLDFSTKFRISYLDKYKKLQA